VAEMEHPPARTPHQPQDSGNDGSDDRAILGATWDGIYRDSKAVWGMQMPGMWKDGISTSRSGDVKCGSSRKRAVREAPVLTTSKTALLGASVLVGWGRPMSTNTLVL
jgi:hypothetical protein